MKAPAYLGIIALALGLGTIFPRETLGLTCDACTPGGDGAGGGGGLCEGFCPPGTQALCNSCFS